MHQTALGTHTRNKDFKGRIVSFRELSLNSQLYRHAYSCLAHVPLLHVSGKDTHSE